MPALLTYSMSASVIALLALDVPLPIEIPALAMVALVLRYFLRKDVKIDAGYEERMRRLEEAIEDLQQDNKLTHHNKHLAIGRMAGVRGMLVLAQQQLRICTCGSTAPLIPVFGQVIDMLHYDDLTTPAEGTSP